MNIDGKIIKLIVGMIQDENGNRELTQLVVERENGTKAYTENLNKHFSKIVKELYKENKEELDGLTTNKEKVAKLQELNKIIIDNTYVYIPRSNNIAGKIKNLVFNKKVLVGSVVALAIGVGSYKIVPNLITKVKNDTTIDKTDELETPNPTATPKPTATPAPEVLELDSLSLESEDIMDVDDVDYSEVSNSNLTLNEGLDLDQLIEESFNDMSDITNNIRDNLDLQDSGTMINYENFVEDEAEKVYIKYFSILRNEIIYQVYRNEDMDTVRKLIKKANIDILKALINNEVVQDGNYQMTYEDLSNETKELFLNIICTFPDGLRETIEFEGEEYTNQEISELIVEKYENISKSK